VVFALLLPLALSPIASLEADPQRALGSRVLATAPLTLPDDPLPGEAKVRAQEVLRQARNPRGVAALIRLRALRDELADPSLVDSTVQRVARDAGAHPFTRTAARQMLAEIDLTQGRIESAAKRINGLGYIQDVFVLGGFDNDGKGGCETDFGPEKKLDLKASYPAKGHEARWRPMAERSGDGGVDLGAALRPNKAVVAYALALLDEKAARRAVLDLGTSGAYRLWVNGEKVASDDAYHPARPDQERLSVQLRAGVNRLLLKVCHDEGALGFYLRDEAAAARPVHPDHLGPPPVGAVAPKRLPTLVRILEAQVKAHPDDAQLRGDFARVLEATQAFEVREHTDAVQAERAAADAAQQGRDDARLELLAARLQHDDNVRRRHVEAAVAADPGLAEAQLALAHAELSQSHPDRARQLLESLVRRWPGFLAAQLTLARAEDELGDSVSATQRVESLADAAARTPDAARDRVRAARRLDRNDEAVQRLRAFLSARPGEGSSLALLAELLADQGQVDGAVDALRRALRLSPTDNGLRLRLAELLASNGRVDEGVVLFQQAEALCPDEPEVYERKGRSLLYAGRKDAALEAFERSLVLRPQNPGLKEAVRALRGGDAGAAGPSLALDVRPLIREADSYAEDAVTLVDNTYVRVQQSGLSSRFHQMAVKVFTRRGADAFRSFPITYSPSREEVRILRARITKPDGSLVESFGDTNRSLNEPWSGMYYDAQAKMLSFPGLAPGDLLEIQYRLEDTASDNLLSDYWGDLAYVQGITPKLRWQFVVDMPAGRSLYWNEKTLPPGVSAKHENAPDGRVLYRFEEARVSRVTPEPGMPGWSEVATTLHVSTYRSWDDVGRYYWSLIRDQLVPDDSVRRAVEAALKGVDRKDTRAVVRTLYEYVVKNTRYVALEFGIHGYKPYRVDRVLARRFGDCKDKAALLYAMLGVAGVDSRIVLLRMRQLGNIAPEPASLAVFNHAIVWVPSLDWYLDGTAEFHGATELPPSDRRASILVIESGGRSRFTVTPEARAEDNVTDVELELALRPGGGAEVKGESRVRGSAAPEYRRSYQSAATRRSAFEQGWAQTFPGLSVDKVSISDPTRLDQDVALDYQLNIPRYAEVGGDTLRFFPFGSRRGYLETYAGLAERRGDLVLDGPSVSRFTFRYRLPKGWSVDGLPPDVSSTGQFGQLTVKYSVEPGVLVCRGELIFSRDRIPAQDYPAFRAFVAQIDQAFSRKVLVRGPQKGASPQRARRAGTAPALATR
jgi:tetratricopeptide (TPR) repeat protein/transglutaminase-like putative cysteine protease